MPPALKTPGVGAKVSPVSSAVEMVSFVATGVTDGALLDGVRIQDGIVRTHSMVMNSHARSVREIRLKRTL